MEMIIVFTRKAGLLKPWVLIWFCLMSTIAVQAQVLKNGISVDESTIYLTLNKKIPGDELQNIVTRYELEELPLGEWLNGKNLDKISQYDWKLKKQDQDWFIICRSLESLGNISKLEKKILIAGEHHDGSELYPMGVNRKVFGFNKLRKSEAIVVKGQKVTIYLSGYTNYKDVKLAGSFTQWQNRAISMQKSPEGWIVSLDLEPGKYYYKFITDGSWILHSDNVLKENDGMGNTNSVFYIPNQTFTLNGFEKASKVYLAGTFNNWDPGNAAMKRTKTGWELPVFLPNGTYTYRLIADGAWMEDPANKNKVQNEFGAFNSVVRIGKPYIFRLDGFTNASEVKLVGSFNNWRQNEIYLEPKAGGWEANYAIGAGNHEYYYLVDGDRLGRKSTNSMVEKPSEPLNFNTILLPNYTFQLKGNEKATSVFISGTFNNWSKTGFPMTYENGAWRINLHLTPGKQSYKFVVDGKWMIDPANPLWENNEQGTKNSVLWLEGS